MKGVDSMAVKEAGLVVGDKVDLTKDRRRFYKSTVWETSDNGMILIGAPVYKGLQMQLMLGDELFLVYYRDTGRYVAKMRAVGHREKDDVQYTLLEQLTQPEKNQRREYYRLHVSAPVQLFEYKDGIEATLSIRDGVRDSNMFADAKMKDISVSGIALTTKWGCKENENYVLKLTLQAVGSKPVPLTTCAKVMRAGQEQENGTKVVGLKFFGLTKDKSDFLSKYIITQQQKMIVQIKLVEGE